MSDRPAGFEAPIKPLAFAPPPRPGEGFVAPEEKLTLPKAEDIKDNYSLPVTEREELEEDLRPEIELPDTPEVQRLVDAAMGRFGEDRRTAEKRVQAALFATRNFPGISLETAFEMEEALAAEPEGVQPEGILEYLDGGARTGFITSSLGMVGWRLIFDTDNPELWRKYSELMKMLPERHREYSWPIEMLRSGIEVGTPMAEGLHEALPKGLLVGLGSLAAVSTIGNIGPLAASPFEEGIAFFAGFAKGTAATASEYWLKLEAGSSFIEMLSVRGPNGERIDLGTSRVMALGVGTLSAAIEVMEASTLIKAYPIAGDLLKTSLSKGIRNIFSKQIFQNSVFAFAKKHGLDLAKRWGAEVLEELAQELVHIGGVEIAKAIREEFLGIKEETLTLSTGEKRIVQTRGRGTVPFPFEIPGEKLPEPEEPKEAPFEFEKITPKELADQMIQTFSGASEGMLALLLPGAAGRIVQGGIETIGKTAEEHKRLTHAREQSKRMKSPEPVINAKARAKHPEYFGIYHEEGERPEIKIRQRTDNIDELMRDAAESRGELENITSDWKKKSGATDYFMRDELKARERIKQKIRTDYTYDGVPHPERAVDLNGGTLVFKNLPDARAGLEKISKDKRILRVKDRFARPTEEGYTDVLVNVRLKNGHVAEIQLHSEPVLWFKQEGPGHKLYSVLREINSKFKELEKKGELTAELKAEANRLSEDIKLVLRTAYEAAGTAQTLEEVKAFASSSEILTAFIEISNALSTSSIGTLLDPSILERFRSGIDITKTSSSYSRKISIIQPSTTIIGQTIEEVKPEIKDFHGPAIEGEPAAGAATITIRADQIPENKPWYDLTAKWDEIPQYRGAKIDLQDPRVPDQVYHVTTHFKAVRDAGKIQARGEGGLGGDPNDRIVSFTVDREIAERIRDDLKLAVEIGKIDEEVHSLPLGARPEDRTEWGLKIVERLREQSRREGWEFMPNFDPESMEPGTELQIKTYDSHDWLTQYFIERENKARINNPIILTSSEILSKLDPEDIEIIEVPKENLNTGALITDFDLGRNGLEEVRIYGDVMLPKEKILTEAELEREITEEEFSAEMDKIINEGFDDFLAEERAFREIQRRKEELAAARKPTKRGVPPETGPFALSEWTRESLSSFLGDLGSAGYAGKGYSPIVIGYIRAVLKTGGLTEEQFRKALYYLNQNPEKYLLAQAYETTGEIDPEMLEKLGYDIVGWGDLDPVLQEAKALQQKWEEIVEAVQEARFEAKAPTLREFPDLRTYLGRRLKEEINESLKRLQTQTPAGLAGKDIQKISSKARDELKKAFTQGKREGAAVQKIHQRLLILRQRVQRQNREEFAAIKKDLQRALKATEKMSDINREPILHLLEDIDFVRANKRTRHRLDVVYRYLEDNPEAEVPSYVLEALKRRGKTPLAEMTMQDVRDLHMGVMHYAHQEGQKQRIREYLKRKRRHEAAREAIGDLPPPGDARRGLRSQGGGPGIAKYWKSLMVRSEHYDLVVQKIAGVDSVINRILNDVIKEGITKQTQYYQKAMRRFRSALARRALEIKAMDKWINDTVKIKNVAAELRVKGKDYMELQRGERIAFYMHSLNPDNRASMLGGGVGFKNSDRPNHVYALSERDLQRIIASMSPEELVFAQVAAELFERQGKELDEVFYELNGYHMAIEKNYYRKDTMPVGRGGEALIDLEKEDILERFKGRTVRPGVYKGMLEKRRRVTVPLYINNVASDINKSVLNAAAYIGLEEPMREASALFFNKEFNAKLRDSVGDLVAQTIEQGMRDIAGEYKAYTDIEEALLKLRNRMSTSILGLDVFIGLKQLLSYGAAWTYVDMKYLVQGIGDATFDWNNIKQRHKIYSPEYLARAGGFSRDVRDVIREAGQFRDLLGGRRTLREKSMGIVQFFDDRAVVPLMQAAVLQALDSFKAGKLHPRVAEALRAFTPKEEAKILSAPPEEQIKLAYKFADYVVERSQPMFRPEHQAALVRGTPLEKLVTQFSGWTNAAFTLLRRANAEIREGRPGAWKNAAKAYSMVLIANTVGVFLIDSLRKMIRGKEPDDNLALAFLKTIGGMFYFIRDAVYGTTAFIQSKGVWGADLDIPVQQAAERIVSGLGSLILAMVEEDDEKRARWFGKFFKAAMETFLMMKGIPYRPVMRAGQAIMEEEE